MKQIVCDRCGAVISSDDEEAGEIDRNDMTDDWQIAGPSEPLGDLCGACVKVLRVWIKSTPKVKQRRVQE